MSTRNAGQPKPTNAYSLGSLHHVLRSICCDMSGEVDAALFWNAVGAVAQAAKALIIEAESKGADKPLDYAAMFKHLNVASGKAQETADRAFDKWDATSQEFFQLITYVEMLDNQAYLANLWDELSLAPDRKK